MEIYRKRKESFRSYHQRKLNEIWEKKKVYRNMKFVQIKRNADRGYFMTIYFSNLKTKYIILVYL